MKTAQVQAEELAKENDLAQKEVETFDNSIPSQLAVQEATVNQKRAMYELKKSQMDQLHIRPGIDGMLQELDVEVGQKVTHGHGAGARGAAHPFEGATEDCGDPGERYSDRAEGDGGYAQRNHSRTRHALSIPPW